RAGGSEGARARTAGYRAGGSLLHRGAGDGRRAAGHQRIDPPPAGGRRVKSGFLRGRGEKENDHLTQRRRGAEMACSRQSRSQFQTVRNTATTQIASGFAAGTSFSAPLRLCERKSSAPPRFRAKSLLCAIVALL